MKYLKLFENFNKKIYYHGSNNKFENFENYDNKLWKEINLSVWFFTEDLEYAKTYGKYIYEVELAIHNTFNTEKKEHFDIFLKHLKENKFSKKDIEKILDEQFFNDLPYWTCDEAFYAAVTNNFDSIFIEEQLEKEVVSIGVFDNSKIKIIKVY
jgi:hypothetical protein